MAAPVRVRFAPSPTGHLHVGGARTALFNWLYARHHGGAFVLRIEDTDRSRSTEENIGLIVEALEWLGLDWDEGPPAPGYRQTERLPSYREHAERLRAAGRAYYCDCAPADLERARRAAQARKETFRYAGRCRDRGLRAGALRLRIPDAGATVVNDLIHGPVTFEHGQLDDWILVRSDGTPTYNFCVVVDDVTMRITHVIRGDDHLSNTPKQILCYEALGYPVPEMAHVSMILGPDRSRLSSRHGATAVQAFRDAGIVPEAMVNYLARLGWSHGDQEIFSRQELVELFDVKAVASSGAVFDHTKLAWLSHEYLKAMDGARLAALATPFIRAAGLAPPADPARLSPILDTLRERARTLVELVAAGRFYFEAPSAYEPVAAQTFLTPEGARRLGLLRERLAALTEFSAGALEGATRGLAAELGLKLVDLAQLSRLAVTGGTASPPIFAVLALLGRAETLARLDRARAVAGGAA
ncbi:MAG: glutamate--tRNA ligase [Candidatus Rokubacteria bacterium]|nr:glutamate--tRNA ligase [Candidatus Rokubacteria bacterium]